MRIVTTSIIALFLGALALVRVAHADAPLAVYGPGGPAPAMKEAAAAFHKKTGIAVRVTAGPTPQWLEQAKGDADLIYSGSEAMMADFVVALDGRIAHADVTPLYLRPLSILVRPGNPKKIRGLESLLAPGIQVLVVQGAGQTGAWEDAAGRKGDIKTVQRLRRNIVGYAANSAEARERWTQQPELDAWIIWNIWQVANPKLADVVAIEPAYVIYRDTAIVPTTRGKANPAAQQFIAFLASPQGAAIFKKWGWRA